MSDEFPVPVAAPPAPAPEPAPEPPAVEPAPAEPPPAEPHENEEPPPLPKGVQRRIDRAVRQRYEAEARARVAEEELARWRNQPAAPRQAAPAEEAVPTIDKFDNIEDYVTAKAKWVANQQIQEALGANEQRTRQQREQHEASQLASSWQERVSQAVAEIPDFEDVLGSSEVPMSPAMERALVESEVGPKLAYWLAQNPAEATKISQLPPMRAFAALGRIEERLQTAPPPPPPKLSNAPPPIEPAGSRANVTKNPDDMTTEEWMAWRQKQLKSR